MSDKFEFIDRGARSQHDREQHSGTLDRKNVRLAGDLPFGILRMAGPARFGYSTKARGTQAVHYQVRDSDGTYGHRRVHADLAGWGVPCGPELVRSLMRELALEPCQPRPWRFSLTENDGQAVNIPDLVQQDFTAAAPRAENGWGYYVHSDVGRLDISGDRYRLLYQGRGRLDDNYKTQLIDRAIEMAARNHRFAADAIFHHDYAEVDVKPENLGMACSGRAC